MRVANKVDTLQSETEYLDRILPIAFESRMAMALWRLPDDTSHHLIISNEHQLIEKEKNLEDLPTGFIFAPFDNNSDRIFIERELYFVFKDEKLSPAESPQQENSLMWLASQTKSQKKSIQTFLKASSHVKEKDHQDFIDMVKAGIESIQEKSLEKIVLSRLQRFNVPDGFDIVQAFRKLCNAYPSALISFVHIPDVGTWLGASPEILVSVENGTIFRTVALAGTKAYHNEINLKSVTWTQKEIEEQALVERYIISCFKMIRLREYDEHGPKTAIAGNLLHLKSDFTVDMKATNFPQLGSVMLRLLHPTSAVCGMPLDFAKDFLKKHEGYDREFYAGYLGPVNMNNDTHIFVNLRCLQFRKDEALLYAGAGVTEDSLPESEWEETEIKLNTLSNILF